MREIRVCWLPEIEHVLAPGRTSGPWLPWSAEAIDLLIHIQQSGSEVYGPGSHWVEQRHAPGM